ncbi:MAG: (Na+)-NQR maturation NqrM [Pseudomonadales bacterium]|jgi:hypothetical protein
MAEFFLAFIIMLAAVAAMAIGVINGRKPISGTCGGLNNEGTCSLCGGDTAKCETVATEPKTPGRFYDAS